MRPRIGPICSFGCRERRRKAAERGDSARARHSGTGLRPFAGHGRRRAHRRRWLSPSAPGSVPGSIAGLGRHGVGSLRCRHPARRPPDARRAPRPGRPVHGRAEASGRPFGASGCGVADRVPVRARRCRGRDRAARVAGDPHRLVDDHRRRIPGRPAHRAVRGHRARRLAGPGTGGDAAQRAGTGGGGAETAACPWDPAVQRDVVRQRARQRFRGPDIVQRVRGDAGSGSRRVGASQCCVSQLHGRPDHPHHER